MDATDEALTEQGNESDSSGITWFEEGIDTDSAANLANRDDAMGLDVGLLRSLGIEYDATKGYTQRDCADHYDAKPTERQDLDPLHERELDYISNPPEVPLRRRPPNRARNA